jgi:hypothetical protein
MSLRSATRIALAGFLAGLARRLLATSALLAALGLSRPALLLRALLMRALLGLRDGSLLVHGGA